MSTDCTRLHTDISVLKLSQVGRRPVSVQDDRPRGFSVRDLDGVQRGMWLDFPRNWSPGTDQMRKLGSFGCFAAISGVRQRARKSATAQTRPMPTRPAAFEHKLAGLTSSICVLTSPQVENRGLECGSSNSCRGMHVLTYPAVRRS